MRALTASLIVAAAATLAGAATPSTSAGPPPLDSGPLPTIGGVTAKSRIEPRFSRIASRIAGAPRQVRCWSPADWRRLDAEWLAFTDYKFGLQRVLGYTSSDHARTNLAPATCTRLVALAYRKQWPKTRAGRDDLADAVTILAHESQHLKGIDDEAAAECYGQQFVRFVARQLGASRAQGDDLARLAWVDRYPTLARQFRSPDCREGGALDLRPASRIFP